VVVAAAVEVHLFLGELIAAAAAAAALG